MSQRVPPKAKILLRSPYASALPRHAGYVPNEAPSDPSARASNYAIQSLLPLICHPNLLLAGTMDGLVLLWELSTHRLVYQFQAHTIPQSSTNHTTAIIGLAYIWSTHTLFTHGRDGHIKTWKWDLTSEHSATTLPTHVSTIQSMAGTFCSFRVISSSYIQNTVILAPSSTEDSVLQIWDVERSNSHPLAELVPPEDTRPATFSKTSVLNSMDRIGMCSAVTYCDCDCISSICVASAYESGFISIQIISQIQSKKSSISVSNPENRLQSDRGNSACDVAKSKHRSELSAQLQNIRQTTNKTTSNVLSDINVEKGMSEVPIQCHPPIRQEIGKTSLLTIDIRPRQETETISDVHSDSTSNATCVGICAGSSKTITMFSIHIKKQSGKPIDTRCQILANVTLPTFGVSTCTIRHDAKFCVIGGWDGAIRLFDLRHNRELRPLAVLLHHTRAISSIQFFDTKPIHFEHETNNEENVRKWFTVSDQEGAISVWDIYAS